MDGGGGGLHGPPLSIISCHSVGDAPTSFKFLDFSLLHLYFHLVMSFFTCFCNFYKKIIVKIFFPLKKKDFLTKMVKIIFFSHKHWHFLFKNCDQYSLRNFLRRVTCVYVKNWRCWKFIPNPSHFWVSETSRLLLKRLCNSGGWSRAQMKA